MPNELPSVEILRIKMSLWEIARLLRERPGCALTIACRLDQEAAACEAIAEIVDAEHSTLAAGVCEYRSGNAHGNPLCLKTNTPI